MRRYWVVVGFAVMTLATSCWESVFRRKRFTEKVLWAAMRGRRERIAEVKESMIEMNSTLSDDVCGNRGVLELMMVTRVIERT